MVPGQDRQGAWRPASGRRSGRPCPAGRSSSPAGRASARPRFVNAILLILRAKKVRCLLCAPTGRAAKRLSETTGVEAKTIHRLLEVNPASRRLHAQRGAPLECDLLVVDETSWWMCC